MMQVHSNTMDDAYNNIDDHNTKRKRITINHSADIDYKEFLKIYRKCTSRPYFFLLLPADNSLRFRKKSGFFTNS